jgi:hypothetical protein
MNASKFAAYIEAFSEKLIAVVKVWLQLNKHPFQGTNQGCSASVGNGHSGCLH